ncbi:MAG TPA: L-rhamnose mutarotase [Acidimicrobiales bacterium]|nr:L-rhamnose mutarotase [Acidimicrobiales bacterium]
MAAEGDEHPAPKVRREAWVMWLKPGNEEIYKQKHDEIWPELVDQIRAHGISNYSIYRDGLTLFAYLERDGTAPLPEEPDPVTWRWWKMMEPYMECNADGSPRRGEVEEMFHLE